jgi:adenine-specific DNA-methyltransferase
MILDASFDRKAFQGLVTNLLPDMTFDVRAIESQSDSFISATMLGRSINLDLHVLEILVAKGVENRVSITRNAFTLLKNYGIYNAIVVFKTEKNEQWRISLMTATAKLESGKSVISISNPKRNSFVLGPSAKTKTPTKLLLNSGKVQNLQELQDRFSIEVVNKEFFADVARLYRNLVGDHSKENLSNGLKQEILRIPESINIELAKQQFAVRLIGRLVFCWFLRQKKSQKDVPLLPNDFFDTSGISKSFYHEKLEPLFFETLNKPVSDRSSEFSGEPYSSVPYLNGGLFYPKVGHGGDYYEGTAGDSQDVVVSNSWFVDFFELLDRFNFTVDENSSFDTDLSVDPEMLGRIFENLLAEINPDTGEAARKSTGSFYTPRSVVDYMVDRTIFAFLKEKTDVSDSKLRSLISYDQMDDLENPLLDEEKKEVALSLLNFKVLDPACGSGAFPIGILQKVVWIQQQVDPNAEIWLENQLSGLSTELQKHLRMQVKNENFDYLRKLGVIRESLFGVDVQPIATEMSRLRCFLTLIVEENVKDGAENRGIQPLPNLEFKFITANSLMDLSEVDEETSNYPSMFDDNKLVLELKDMRDQYFTSTGKSRIKIMDSFTKVQKEMQSNLNTLQFGMTSKAFRKLADWDPFGVDGVDWFDADWMFGLSKFDAVICNPPYVGEKGHKEMFREIRNSGLRDFYQGKMDLFYFFFHLALDHTNEKGIITFITTNYFPTALGARNLRNDLKARSSVLEIVNFNELRIFESALGQHNMITILEKGHREVKAIFNIVTANGLVKHQDLDPVLHKTEGDPGIFVYAQNEVFDGPESYIRFPTSELDSILSEMAKSSHRLIDICNVNQGLVSGADRFSDSHRAKYPKIRADKSEGIFQVSLAEAVEFPKINHLKPFFKNSDIRNWIVNTEASSKILFLQRDSDPTEFELAHLKKFKPILETRRGVNKDTFPWWALYWPRKLEMYEGVKIVCPQRSSYNKFSFSEGSWFAASDVFFITAKTDTTPMKAILGLIKSRLYFVWLYNRGKRKGEALELVQNPLTEIPIPMMSKSQVDKLSKLVDQILVLARIEQSEQEIENLESEIDQVVYSIFSLSDMQVASVEKFWSAKRLKFDALNSEIEVTEVD